MSGYQRPAAARGVLRLHLNENTAGCPPSVLSALGTLSADDIAFYPEYDAIIERTASYLDVPADWLLLTNGLDEGILAATVAAARSAVASGAARPEVIVPLPAFDMYGVCADAVGARLVQVMPRADLRLGIDAIQAAITAHTKLVFITSPNNPTGVRVRLGDIAAVADALPPGAHVFVDEAYHDFCGDTALSLTRERPNVIVGRTFAKAHGLAALRVGCVIAQPGTLAPLRLVVPPYSVNICAVRGLAAALDDDEWLEWYVDQVRRSRNLLYAFCERRGLQYWESGANFVMLRVGSAAARLTAALAARGIVIRERHDPGCEGCIRVTAGVLADTERCVAAMEELL